MTRVGGVTKIWGVVSECLCEYDDNDDDQNHSTDHTQDDHFLPEREEQSIVSFNNNAKWLKSKYKLEQITHQNHSKGKEDAKAPDNMWTRLGLCWISSKSVLL